VSHAVAGRIGPNAIIQTAAALRARVGDSRSRTLVHGATGRALEAMPAEMVDEAEVNQLVHALRHDLDPALFEAVLRDAGARTAAYLMAHRIPRPVQWLMRVLPAPLALRVLFAGIMRHTWTFAGTAAVTLERRPGEPLRLVMRHCPMCRDLRASTPACHFYAGTLGTLLARLVTPRAEVVEVACEATGAPACEFALRLD
jgi:divinyl protochlorophyllide a 8-vinyl-reductase